MEAFVVRVWRPHTAEPSDGLHGTAVHLSSGKSVTFTDAPMLIRFLVESGAGSGGGAATTAADGQVTPAP